MSLRNLKFIFIDCQTTGMRPPAGHLLDIGWAIGSADTEQPEAVTFLAQLPDDVEIPKMVREITGLSPEDLKDATAPADIFKALKASIEDQHPAMIHYAQFEKPYLNDLFTRFGENQTEPGIAIFCSQGLSKRLLPNLPSHNIRAVAGYFGFHLDHVQRAKTHVLATHHIWKHLVLELEKLEVHSLDDLKTWMENSPRAKATRYEYRLDKIKRLELPNQPGVYRMISKSGEVLYVGKATSLKSRVNSYFRGQKNRNKQKLELLAQVWDLRVTGCATPLEAALLETDEIKRYNPRYNVVLKRGARHLVFYNHTFSKCQKEQSETFCIGPFRNFNWIETLRELANSLAQNQPIGQIFFEPIELELIHEGFEIFLQTYGFQSEQLANVRALLAAGLHLIRIEPEEPEGEEVPEDVDENEEEEVLTAIDVCGKFERLFKRAAHEYLKSKRLTKLLNSHVVIQAKAGPRDLFFQKGSLKEQPEQIEQTKDPWRGLGIDDFDRMSILNSEMAKCEGRLV